MGYRSNLAEVQRALGVLGAAFHMERQLAEGRTLGQEILDLAAATIEERTRVRKLEPDNSPLAALKPSTIKRKVRKGFPPEIGVETGAMLDKGEIAGESRIEEDTVSMTYGVGADEVAKAEWFQEGRPGVQAARPFYDLGADGEDRLDELIEEVAEQARVEFET